MGTSGGGREGLTRLFVVINIYIYILTESEWRKEVLLKAKAPSTQGVASGRADLI